MESATEINLSPQRRTMLDAQALQFIRAAVDRNIVKQLSNTYSTFSAYKLLEEMFEQVRSLEYILLHRKFFQLRFRRGYDLIRYCAEFEDYIQQYEDLKTTFSDAYLATIFVEKIDDSDHIDSPYYHFSSNIATNPLETQTYSHVKQSFIEIASKDKVINPKRSEKRKFESSSTYKENRDAKRPNKNQNQHPLSKEQIVKLKRMDKDEWKKIQCYKCGGYFHRAENCLNQGRVCFKCHRIGHESNACTFDFEKDKK